MNKVIRDLVLPEELTLSDSELSARLGHKARARDEKIQAVCRELFDAADIKFVAARLSLEKSNAGVRFAGISVKSEALSQYFCDSSEAYLFILTLGAGVDRLIMKKKARSVSDGFIYDAVASAIVEAACDAAEKKICGEKKTKNRFSPGYSDCPLAVQLHVLELLSADKYIGVKLLDSMLMSPMKSVSAFIAILPEGESL